MPSRRVTAVERRPVPVRVRERVDRAGVVEERVRRSASPCGSGTRRRCPLRRRRVVDVDRVDDVLAERVEVRPARRLLERDVVGDDRDRVRLVRATERVDVRVVRDRVLADQRGLAVARGPSFLRPAPERDCERGRDQERSHEGIRRLAHQVRLLSCWQRPDLRWPLPGGRRLFVLRARSVRPGVRPSARDARCPLAPSSASAERLGRGDHRLAARRVGRTRCRRLRPSGASSPRGARREAPPPRSTVSSRSSSCSGVPKLAHHRRHGRQDQQPLGARARPRGAPTLGPCRSPRRCPAARRPPWRPESRRRRRRPPSCRRSSSARIDSSSTISSGSGDGTTRRQPRPASCATAQPRSRSSSRARSSA